MRFRIAARFRMTHKILKWPIEVCQSGPIDSQIFHTKWSLYTQTFETNFSGFKLLIYTQA